MEKETTMMGGAGPWKTCDARPYTTRTTCRVCDGLELSPLFSLGEHWVSDFVAKERIHAGIKAPIELVLCERCGLVQLKHTAPQELLYSRHYWYKSSTTQTMFDALRDITRAIEERVPLDPGDVVCDLGSNDGTLLRSYETGGIIKVGVEPAVNLAEEGAEGLDGFINDFWSAEAFGEYMDQLDHGRIRHVKAKVITAIGMAYDLEDPNAFIADVAKVLAPDGVFVAQLMCMRNMVNVGDVGNLCAEHLEYYTLESLDWLLEKHGLEIRDIETNAVNGESYRLWIRHRAWTGDWANAQAAHRVNAARIAEERMGLDSPEFYHTLFAKMEANRRNLVEFVRDAVGKGKRVWVYGASTKGNTLLQYYGLDHSLIEAAADKSPEKWGKYTIGTGIPIVSEAKAREVNPDFFLVLPYAFLPEFMVREEAWLEGGGKFLVPLPEFRIVGKGDRP